MPGLVDVQCDANVHADKQRIVQVLNNLLLNAGKYSPEGSRNGVRMFCENALVRVEIKDQGRGIPTHMQELVFDRYSRVTSNKDAPGGLGLGLYISSSIIRGHDGRIGVDSEESNGSTFFFILPKHTEKDLAESTKDAGV